MTEIVLDVFSVRCFNKEVLIAFGHRVFMGNVRYHIESIGYFSTFVHA